MANLVSPDLDVSPELFDELDDEMTPPCEIVLRRNESKCEHPAEWVMHALCRRHGTVQGLICAWHHDGMARGVFRPSHVGCNTALVIVRLEPL